MPVLVAFVLASQPRSRWWSLAAAGAVGLAAGSFWFVLNLAETGDPGGGTGFDQGLDPVLERVRLSFVDLFELSDAEGTGFLASPLWGLGALAVASTVAAVIAVRGRLRAGGVALLVGVMAFFAAPLVVTWARVADRVLAHAGSAGRAYERADDTAAGRLPRVADALFVRAGFRRVAVGAGVLVVDDVRRRRLPGAALVALVGVPTAVLLTALALAYDPQRMRYIVFSVALAATVLGTALRVRALAWTSVALTAITLTVSVAYFVPRPAGLALLSQNRSPERSARWFVQAESGNGDPAAFRFLAERSRRKRRSPSTSHPTRTSTLPGTRGCDEPSYSSPTAARYPTTPSGSWSGRLGQRTRIASQHRGGRSGSRLRAAGESSVGPEAAAHDAFRGVRPGATLRVPTRPAAPRTMRAGATGIANSTIV